MGVFIAVALAGMAVTARGEESKVLYIYTWKDYFDSDVIGDFQKKYNCQVDTVNFVSNEDLYRTLKEGQADFDLITPSSYMSSKLWAEGLLARIDHRLVPNLRHLDPSAPQLGEDPDMVYSIPYTRTICGVAYHKRLVDEADLGGWDIFGNRYYAGKMTMIDDMRETIGAALKHLGYSLNSVDEAELEQAGRLLVQWKKNLSALVDDDDRMIVNDSDRLANHCYNGDVALMIAEDRRLGPDIGFYVPRAGSSQVADDFVIPANAVRADLAHAFINHLLEPANAKENMEGIYFHMFVPEALDALSEDLQRNPAFSIPPEMVARCEVIHDVGPHIEKYQRIWRTVLAAE